MEARAGIEPACKDLQSSASPLRHRASLAHLRSGEARSSESDISLQRDLTGFGHCFGCDAVCGEFSALRLKVTWRCVAAPLDTDSKLCCISNTVMPLH